MDESYFDGLRVTAWDCIPHYDNDTVVNSRNYYTIQFNQSGFFEYSFNNRPFKRVFGAYAWVTHPQTLYRFRSPPGTDRYHRFVSFAGRRCDAYVEKGLIPPKDPSPVVMIRNQSEFIAAFDALQKSINPSFGPIQIERYKRGTIYVEHEISNIHYAVYLLEGVLLQLHNQSQNSYPGNRVTSIAELIKRIKAEPEVTRSFSDEARKMRVSISYFRKLFSKIAGFTPVRYMRKVRMEKAARLLLETDQSVSSIAETVGYQDA